MRLTIKGIEWRIGNKPETITDGDNRLLDELYLFLLNGETESRK